MLEKILIRILPKIWEASFKKLEKLNIITRALEQCFKNKLLRATWNSFLNSVTSWLEDAINEVNQARSWSSPD